MTRVPSVGCPLLLRRAYRPVLRVVRSRLLYHYRYQKISDHDHVLCVYLYQRHSSPVHLLGRWTDRTTGVVHACDLAAPATGDGHHLPSCAFDTTLRLRRADYRFTGRITCETCVERQDRAMLAKAEGPLAALLRIAPPSSGRTL